MHVLDICGVCSEHSLMALYKVQGHFFLFLHFLKLAILTSLPYVFDHLIQLNLTGSSLLSDAILMKIASLCQKVKVILSFKH